MGKYIKKSKERIRETRIVNKILSDEELQTMLKDGPEVAEFCDFEGVIEISSSDLDEMIPTDVIDFGLNEDGIQIVKTWSETFVTFSIKEKVYLIVGKRLGDFTWSGCCSCVAHAVMNHFGAKRSYSVEKLNLLFKEYLESISGDLD